MSMTSEISELLQQGRAKLVKQKVAEALDSGLTAKEILEDGCEISIALSRYNEQTNKFESDEFYTYVLSSSVHTYACLRELDILN